MKSQIDSILQALVHATETGCMAWTEEDPASKARGYKRKMCASGSDGTAFHTTIEYMLMGERWDLQSNPIFVMNPNLPNGMHLITKYSNPDIDRVRDAIMAKFCKDLNPSINTVEDLLDDIAKGISISSFRDKKLGDIGL